MWAPALGDTYCTTSSLFQTYKLTSVQLTEKWKSVTWHFLPFCCWHAWHTLFNERTSALYKHTTPRAPLPPTTPHTDTHTTTENLACKATSFTIQKWDHWPGNGPTNETFNGRVNKVTWGEAAAVLAMALMQPWVNRQTSASFKGRPQWLYQCGRQVRTQLVSLYLQALCLIFMQLQMFLKLDVQGVSECRGLSDVTVLLNHMDPQVDLQQFSCVAEPTFHIQIGMASDPYIMHETIPELKKQLNTKNISR